MRRLERARSSKEATSVKCVHNLSFSCPRYMITKSPCRAPHLRSSCSVSLFSLSIIARILEDSDVAASSLEEADVRAWLEASTFFEASEDLLKGGVGAKRRVEGC